MFRSGSTLGGRYVLVQLVARGGMGAVWQADDTVLGRTVAVKVLHSAFLGDPDFAQRFRSEARVMASLNHPGIVEVYDYGHSDDVPYLVMQFVDGESLRTLLGRGEPVPPRQTMTLFGQAADALHRAHTPGVVQPRRQAGQPSWSGPTVPWR